MYKILNKERYGDEDGYSIVPLRQEDMESIRLWRNAQMDILRQQAPLSKEQQQKYFIEAVQPTFIMDQPRQILFSYFLGKLLIGYGGLTYIDWVSKRAELSFIVDPPRNINPKAFQNDFRHFLNLLMKVHFEELKFHRLIAETYASRIDIMLPLEQAGFRLEGKLREHVFKRNQWVDSLMYGILATEVKLK